MLDLSPKSPLPSVPPSLTLYSVCLLIPSPIPATPLTISPVPLSTSPYLSTSLLVSISRFVSSLFPGFPVISFCRLVGFIFDYLCYSGISLFFLSLLLYFYINSTQNIMPAAFGFTFKTQDKMLKLLSIQENTVIQTNF